VNVEEPLNLSNDWPTKNQMFPSWGKSPLTKNIAMAHHNSWVCFYQNKFCGKLEDIYQLWEKCRESLYKTDLWQIRFFVSESQSHFIAACSDFSSGRVGPGYSTLRTSLEFAAYAFFMHQNSKYVKTFYNRGIDVTTEKEFKKVFKISKMIKEIKMADANFGMIFERLYNHCVKHGAHPNPYSIFATVKPKELPNGDVEFRYDYLVDGPRRDLGLVATANCGIACLKIFTELIWPKRFKLTVYDLELSRISIGIPSI
jgi:hypothetical protein